MASIRENAFLLLKRIHEVARGDVEQIVTTRKIVSEFGMNEDDAAAAVNYLDGEYLVKAIGEVGNRIPRVFITTSGVNAIEDALRNPRINTHYFPAAQNVINNNVININNNSGHIQQGNVNSIQSNVSSSNVLRMDLHSLCLELGRLREALVKEARTSEQFGALAEVVAAEEAANKGDEPGTRNALAKLKGAGKWVIATAEKIGISLAAAAIKSQAGL